jgi:hypothetical protein
LTKAEVSGVAFPVRPKSFRLIFVVADAPTRVSPQGSFVGAAGPFDAKCDAAVDPMNCQVAGDARFAIAAISDAARLEPQRREFLCVEEICALVSVTLGIVCVSIEETSTDASIFDRLASVPSKRSVPAKFLEWPLTLEVIPCLTLNSSREWTGSVFQALATAGMVSVLMENPLTQFRCVRTIFVATYLPGRGKTHGAP